MKMFMLVGICLAIGSVLVWHRSVIVPPRPAITATGMCEDLETEDGLRACAEALFYDNLDLQRQLFQLQREQTVIRNYLENSGRTRPLIPDFGSRRKQSHEI